jgi:hypothetical protein
MLYKYIYFKVYEWIKERIDPTAPQITSTIILSLFPLSILYVVFRFLSYLGVYKLNLSHTTSSAFIVFIVLFVLLIIINQIYFFALNDWKEIILFFRKNEISNKLKIIANVYIVFCTSVYFILFLFLGYSF